MLYLGEFNGGGGISGKERDGGGGYGRGGLMGEFSGLSWRTYFPQKNLVRLDNKGYAPTVYESRDGVVVQILASWESLEDERGVFLGLEERRCLSLEG